MPRYKVTIPEVHHWTVEVEADNLLDAIDKAGHDFQTDLGTEYSHTLWDRVEIEEIPMTSLLVPEFCDYNEDCTKPALEGYGWCVHHLDVTGNLPESHGGQ